MRRGGEINGADLMPDPRDINRDAKWCLLAVNERLVGMSALVAAPKDARVCAEGRSSSPRVVGSSVLLLRAGYWVGGDRPVGVTAGG